MTWFPWNSWDLVYGTIYGKQFSCLLIPNTKREKCPVHSPQNIQSRSAVDLSWHQSSEPVLFIYIYILKSTLRVQVHCQWVRHQQHWRHLIAKTHEENLHHHPPRPPHTHNTQHSQHLRPKPKPFVTATGLLNWIRHIHLQGQ